MTSLAARAWQRARKGKLNNALGFGLYRFYALRRAARLVKSLTRGEPAPTEGRTLFDGVDCGAAIRDLHRDAYALIHLPASAVQEIRQFADTRPCKARISGREIEFMYAERARAEAEIGAPIHMASYNLKECPLLTDLTRDSTLLQIAAGYLGFPVQDVQPRLFWSFVVDLDEGERLRRGQTVQFHYDLHGFNFIYYHFYLTDTDHAAGAHVLVRGTHHRKPLRYLLSSLNQTDREISEAYGEESIVTLVGPAGFGFAEDTYCYHKALPPQSKDRLMLQLRVS